MIDLVLLGVLLAASGAAGMLVLRAMDALPRRADEHLLAAIATGLGIASGLALLLAALHVLRPWPFAVAAVVALVAGGADFVRALRAVRRRAARSRGRSSRVCAVVLVAEAPTWFAPPVGGDQTKYQLAYPRLWAMAGGLVDTPWCFWGSQQWLQNFLFVLAYAVRGENFARCVNAASGVLAAIALAIARAPPPRSPARRRRGRALLHDADDVVADDPQRRRHERRRVRRARGVGDARLGVVAARRRTCGARRSSRAWPARRR